MNNFFESIGAFVATIRIQILLTMREFWCFSKNGKPK